MRLKRPRPAVIMLGLTLLAFLLRAYHLDAQSYWIDEGWSVYFAHLSPAEMFQRLLTSEAHPPLYHPSTIYWVRLVGDSEYAMRFYSLVFGVLTVSLVYRLGRALGDRRLGLVTALLVVVAPYQIWHSQEARMYTLLTAAAATSMVGFVQVWQRGGRRGWLVYIAGTTWLMYSHYHGLVLIGVQGLFLLLTGRRHWRRYPAWLGALGLVFLLLLPWLVWSWDLLRHRVSWTAQPGLGETYLRSALAYSVGELVPRPEAIWLTLVFVALYGLGLVYATRRPWGRWPGPVMLALLLSYTLAPNLAAWLYGELRTPVYLERYLIPVQLGYLLAVGAGILAAADGWTKWWQRRWEAERQGSRGAGEQRGRGETVYRPSAPPPLHPSILSAAVLLLLLTGISGWVLAHHYFDPAYAKDDWRAVARKIEHFGLPGDAVILTGDGGEKVFHYYYRGSLPVYYPFNTPVPAPDQAVQILRGLAAGHRRLWYSPYGAPIDATLEPWLAGQTYPAWQSWLGRKRLALYAGSQVPTVRLEMVNTAFTDSAGAGPTLVSLAWPGKAIAAGDVLPLALTWQTPAALPGNYQVSLRLSNNRGDSFAQSDWPPLAAGGTSAWPPQQPITDRRGLWVPVDTPPGDYLLQVVVYDPTTGQQFGQPAIVTGLVIGPAEVIVPPEALSIPNPTRIQLGNLTLVGYVIPEKVRPGEEMWAWLYWQAQGPFEPDTRLDLWLNSTGDTNPPTGTFPLADTMGPLDSWQPGQVRRAVYHLPSSPRLSTATTELKARIQPATGSFLTASLAQVTLETRPKQFQRPAISHPVDFSLGSPPVVKLIGYDLADVTPRPAGTLPLTLYWRAEAEMRTSYTVFVQLLNPDNRVVAQVDTRPLAGEAPTTTWSPGEFVTDSYSLALPADLPAGSYRLIAGLYDAATGARLPVSGGGDFVEMPPVTVK